MKRPARSLVLTLGALVSTFFGCTTSATLPVSLELRVGGGGREIMLDDGTRLVLTRADLAFGPFYLCAGAQAGQSCQTALAQWREAEVIDGLEDALVTVGTVDGYSGRALSYMHDCGLVSLLTAEDALVLPAAEELGGRSVIIEGAAELPFEDAPSAPFRFELTLASSREADRGQPVVRSAPGDFDATVDSDSTSVTVRVRPSDWLAKLDASTFWQDTDCATDDAITVCAGATSQDCESGERVDCGTLGQVCVPDRGCQDELVFDDESAAGRAVAQAITLAAGLDVSVE
jgi:hypothetical protein